MRVAVDFDNTLFVGAYPDVGPIVPGARRYVRQLVRDGHKITIWSSRASTLTPDNPIEHAKSLQKMYDALVREGIPFHEIDYGQHGKIPADVYIDDHGLGAPLRNFYGFKVVDWPSAYNLVRLVEISRRLG